MECIHGHLMRFHLENWKHLTLMKNYEMKTSIKKRGILSKWAASYEMDLRGTFLLNTEIRG